jgi:hypothetical protein
VPLLAERTSVSRRSSSTDVILRMATTVTRCGWALFNNILWTDESCFTREGEGVFNVHSSHLWTRDNPHAIREHGYKSASASEFGLLSSGTLSWVPNWYLTGWLLNDIVVFWKLSYRSCLQMCVWLWGRGCGFSTMELERTMGKMSGNGWTRHIQEGGLDVEGRLHVTLDRWIQLRCILFLWGHQE